MFKFVVLFLVASAAAFQSASRVSRSSTILEARKSIALPFLDAPKNLDGTMAGDFGFDPLGFTDNVSQIGYVQAAELKHCRVAMVSTIVLHCRLLVINYY